MLDALSLSLSFGSVLSFVIYIIVAGGLFGLFQMAYTRLTPHKEFVQIREGNVAAGAAVAAPPPRRCRGTIAIARRAGWPACNRPAAVPAPAFRRQARWAG